METANPAKTLEAAMSALLTTERIEKITEGGMALYASVQKHFKLSEEKAMQALRLQTNESLGRWEYIFSGADFGGQVLRQLVGEAS